ncbi:MAG TPA: M48 family metalloprotease [Vicinamibacterales bacterium]|jgi:hypothetical protein
MTYWRLVLSIAFAAFACAAFAASLAAACIIPATLRWLRGAAPSRRASVLFRLRTGPTALAALWAFGIVLPTFLAFEPRGTAETVGRALTWAAVTGVLLSTRLVWRIADAWIATRRLTYDWRRRGRPLDDFDAPIDAFAIDEIFPIVAVVGIRQPRLFVSECVLRDCTAGELSAIVAHETAHVRRRDNLRRLLVHACGGLPPGGRRLDRDWKASIEEAADSRALARDPQIRVDLAQALVRIAKLAAGARLADAITAFYAGGTIESRVRRIIGPAAVDEPRTYGCLLGCSVATGILLFVIAAAPALQATLESAVRLLP